MGNQFAAFLNDPQYVVHSSCHCCRDVAPDNKFFTRTKFNILSLQFSDYSHNTGLFTRNTSKSLNNEQVFDPKSETKVINGFQIFYYFRQNTFDF